MVCSVCRLGVGILLTLFAAVASAQPPRVSPVGEQPADARLERLTTLDGSYFPFDPPASAEEWTSRRERVRRQILVAAGLWPEVPRHAPKAVIHGRVEREEYTVERVYLESYPGHFVTGSLYRPTGKSGRLPAVLSPHGHFAEGRFHAWNDSQLESELASGGEVLAVGGRYPLQSRCVQLARMGCIVFHYDMLGYADSRQLDLGTIHNTVVKPSGEGKQYARFYDVQAELQLHSPLGLQLANSLYALDWLASLPDVDPARIGVTGASGGGSQTFLLCAVDDRPAAAFPAVMVSTAMQGGCGCENACGLRVGAGNVDFAALFAPKPLGMTTADDWTREMSRKGYPELQELYKLLGKNEQVMLADLTQFPHNYNHSSRRAMYEWFARWLQLDASDDLAEREFMPLTRAEMTVWSDDHPQPESGRSHEAALLAEMTAVGEQGMASVWPRDTESAEAYREKIGGAFETLLYGAKTPSHEARMELRDIEKIGRASCQIGWTRDEAAGIALPTVFLLPEEFGGKIVVLTTLEGKSGLWNDAGELRAEVALLLGKGVGVVAADLFDQGEFRDSERPPELASRTNGDDRIPAITYGYNLTPLAQRAHDLLRVAHAARSVAPKVENVYLLALRGSAPYAAAALTLDEKSFDGAAMDTEGFRFTQLTDWRHVHFLPGGARYGDLPGLLALAAPTPLWIAGEQGETPELLGANYAAVGADQRLFSDETDQPGIEGARFLLGLDKDPSR